MPLLWQGTSVALRPLFSPSQFVQDVTESGATVFPAVPFVFERMKSIESVERLPPSFRLLITAGARIDPGTVVWFKERLGRKIHSFYGSSETGGISYDDSEAVTDPLNVGRALPETTVTVRHSEPGAIEGRIFVTGNAVAGRYAQEEGGSVATFCDGGFLTGDFGYVDNERRVILTGRASALVNVAGRKVDPAEVERRLVELPGVVDACVLGVSCDRRGQEVVAFVVREDASLTPLVLRQLCAATLSAHKIPRRFVFVERLPVDSRGKVERRALQALASRADEA